MLLEKLLVVNFGGPRSLEEISPFLCALLTDRDVVRTFWPDCFHRFFFERIARKRAQKIVHDYQLIGGKSPIFEDTEALASALGAELTFHRYLPATHAAFLEKIQQTEADRWCVLPLFPQFSFATTGSIARWFSKNLSKEMVAKMRWIKSYAAHPAYVFSMQCALRDFLQTSCLKEEEVVLLFSAHGLPKAFIETGDIYQEECERSFEAIAQAFPHALCKLCYQSKFGKGEWIRPYTDEVCRDALSWTQGREHVLFIPLSFTSDHIETLFEVEYQYLPLIRAKNLKAYRVPALGLRPDWIESLRAISKKPLEPNSELFRQ